jgi:hypothetical protein
MPHYTHHPKRNALELTMSPTYKLVGFITEYVAGLSQLASTQNHLRKKEKKISEINAIIQDKQNLIQLDAAQRPELEEGIKMLSWSLKKLEENAKRLLSIKIKNESSQKELCRAIRMHMQNNQFDIDLPLQHIHTLLDKGIQGLDDRECITNIRKLINEIGQASSQTLHPYTLSSTYPSKPNTVGTTLRRHFGWFNSSSSAYHSASVRSHTF